MTERDRHLLKAAYIEGWKDGLSYEVYGLTDSDLNTLANCWIDDVIAGNGGTVSEYICHEADVKFPESNKPTMVK